MIVERREFELDRGLIKSIIRAQSGTLEKALLELITNALDAAATRVDVDVNLTSFRVRDNGRGFDETQFHDLFGRFGFEHTGEYARGVGRFGIGRGQAFSLAKTQYRTGHLRASVDIEGEGYGYEVSRAEEQVQGVEVCGELYKPIDGMLLLSVQTELEKLCHYAPFEVWLNGRLISHSPAKERWDAEDDVAYYRCRLNASTMEIYSQGFFVQTHYAGRWGGGGVIVSKQGHAFEQNTARSDVLQHCPEFAHATKVMKGLLRSALADGAKRNVVTDSSLVARVREILAMPDAVEAIKLISTEKLITLIDGKRVSINWLRDRSILTVTDQRSLRAERMLRAGVGVIAEKTLDRFCVRTLGDLIRRVEEIDARSHPVRWRNYFTCAVYEDIHAVPGFSSERFEPAKRGDLSPRAKEALSIVGIYNESIARLCGEAARKIIPGISEDARGWTDGRSFIAIERRMLHRAGTDGYRGFHELLCTLIHEYCHSSSSDVEHGHPIEFWERFAETISQGWAGDLARGMFARHCKSGRDIVKTKLSQLAGIVELDTPVSLAELIE